MEKKFQISADDFYKNNSVTQSAQLWLFLLNSVYEISALQFWDILFNQFKSRNI